MKKWIPWMTLATMISVPTLAWAAESGALKTLASLCPFGCC